MGETLVKETAERMGWEPARLWKVALAYLIRTEQMSEFAGYVARVAKNEAESKARP